MQLTHIVAVLVDQQSNHDVPRLEIVGSTTTVEYSLSEWAVYVKYAVTDFNLSPFNPSVL